MSERLAVKKTTKLFIGGAFPRTESGRTLALTDKRGVIIANYCQASKKDFRNAVLAGNKGFAAWQKAPPYLRSQILYRAAEMLEGRLSQFIAELKDEGMSAGSAKKQVEGAIDRLVAYAGWCDKYQQVFSTVNPVSSPHYNFSVPQGSGVIAVLFGDDTDFLDLIESMSRLLAGGNSLVCLAPAKHPLSAITLGEVWQSSDLPGGVVNILTGSRDELLEVAGTHGDLEGLLGISLPVEEQKQLQEWGSDHMKRLYFEKVKVEQADPYRILDFQETKTTWHPVGG